MKLYFDRIDRYVLRYFWTSVAVVFLFYMNRYRASTEAVLCLVAAVGIDALLPRHAARAPAAG